MTNERVFALLDSSMRWTGIRVDWKPRRRSLRWCSTAALVFAASGFGMLIGTEYRGMGFVFQTAGFSFSVFCTPFGPLIPWGSAEQVDEAHRAARSRAYLGALWIFAAVAICGLCYVIALSVFASWTADQLRNAILALISFLIVIMLAGPTCIASWAQSKRSG